MVFAIILYLATCAGYFIFHRYFVFFPSRRLPVSPSNFQLQYEEVFFQTVDSVRLQGWYIKGKTSEEWKDITFVFFPGNKGSLSDFLKPLSYLAKAGFHVFLFGYRGFGGSEKKRPTEKGVYRDSEAACEYLLKEKEVSVKDMIFFGQSLGCAMAALMAGRFHPQALILEGGFSSLVEVAAQAVKWLPLKRLTTSRFETREFLLKVNCPVLIIHSYEDKAIPLYHADDLLSAVTGQKRKAVISGPHAKGLEQDTEKCLKEIKQFLETIG
jgi:pimeloyl-ACP methyl ester carboxylesterase